MRAARTVIVITLTILVSAPAFGSWRLPKAMPCTVYVGPPSDAPVLQVAKLTSPPKVCRPVKAKVVFALNQKVPAALRQAATSQPDWQVVYKTATDDTPPLPSFLGGPAGAGIVPEPGSMAVLGAGMVGLLLKLRRRRA